MLLPTADEEMTLTVDQTKGLPFPIGCKLFNLVVIFAMVVVKSWPPTRWSMTNCKKCHCNIIPLLTTC